MGDEDLGFWAEKIQPPRLEDIPPAFLEQLPTFYDRRLAMLPFAADYAPSRRPRLLVKPPQQPLPPGFRIKVGCIFQIRRNVVRTVPLTWVVHGHGPGDDEQEGVPSSG